MTLTRIVLAIDLCPNRNSRTENIRRTDTSNCLPSIASPVTAAPVTASVPITCAPCKARLSARGPRNLVTTSTASTETSVSTLNMAGRGMSSDSMPTT